MLVIWHKCTAHGTVSTDTAARRPLSQIGTPLADGSGNDVRHKLIFKQGDFVAQPQLPFL